MKRSASLSQRPTVSPLLLVITAMLSAILACGGEAPAPTEAAAPTTAPGGATTPTAQPSTPEPPPGKRLLAISTTPPLDPPPAAEDFLAALNRAYDLTYGAGVRGDFISWTWRELEPSAQNFNLDEASWTLNYLGKTRSLELLVVLQVLNTTVKETPPDLANVPFDAPQMQQRFHAFVDALLPHLNERVRYLSVGNEVDVYLSAHPEEWGAYKSFYDDAVTYVHSVAPGIQVGVTTTYSGASGASAKQVAELNQSSDIFLLTYYPLDEAFVVKEPAAPLTDFPQMVALAGGKPVILQEVGYPSSATLRSSEPQQAEFVANVFTAWKAAGDKIPFLSFYVLHDLTPKMCDDLAEYYGLPGQAANLKAYLCSLGLRQANGTPKPAWQALVDSAAAAGLP